MSTQFPMLYNLVLKQEQNPSLVGVFQACKEVGRKIKAARDPTAPLPLGNPIPISRQVADSLVGAYLRTFETVHRILHIPTFMSDYARYWQNPRSASPVFTTQLQLVLAIGACFHDDRFEMRGLASRWVHAAQRWLITPPEKGKMNIPGLQIMCLVHLAREVCALGADLLWISAGSLLRTAMYMGFHRDPKNLPGISPFLGEMRRRLWITVLELSLQSSLDSGGSPLISAEDWDTIPPGNYDDEQLTEMMGHQTDSGTAVGLQLPQPKAMTTYTQTSCAIALHKSFPVRLAIATIVNDFRTELSYHKTLQLNTELSAACRNLTTILSSYGPSHGDGRSRPSAFQIRILEQMTQRFFLVLNQVWLRDAQSDARYYFSRKVMVETALRLMRRLDYDSPDSDHEHGQQQTQSQGLTDFRRLTICGAGGFRSVFVACMASLGVELLGQLEDDRSVRTSLGSYPSPSSTSASTPSVHLSSGTPTTATTTSLNIPSIASQETIMAALRPLSKWTERRIRAGETNIKGYVFLDCITAQAEGLMRGESDDVIERGLLGVARERVEFALTVLEEVVAAGRPRWEGELEALQMKEQGVRVVGCTPLSMEDGAGTAFGDGMGVNQNQLGEMPLGQGEWGWEDLVSACFLVVTEGSDVDVCVWLMNGVIYRCKTRSTLVSISACWGCSMTFEGGLVRTSSSVRGVAGGHTLSRLGRNSSETNNNNGIQNSGTRTG